ncbi:uncharacterized protein B0H18DRAFT_1001923 [Fomitopsis serialis]|uniref:uncharacterized protein n=1 Tax=Fomitopsis serialis TaxID=139415 RepID=UPI002007E471|nr:uncharacterized protein B0H18DRAFT_1001923 [Neoantrodia serialis]KAH9927727.1 hypothetical protein B0H18DRAFT_1001923 [Neoantrodia serialis]
MAAIVRGVLGVAAEDFSPEMPFTVYGVSSLSAPCRTSITCRTSARRVCMYLHLLGKRAPGLSLSCHGTRLHPLTRWPCWTQPMFLPAS